ncbi:hypothetical protein GCM10027053_52150 [Intrasporangium mesophilum]
MADGLDDLTNLLDGYATATSRVGASFRKGNRLVTAEVVNGALRVTSYIDHGGADGKTWVEGKTFKSAAGAARFAKGFLR